MIKVKPLVWTELSPVQWSARAGNLVTAHQCTIIRNPNLHPISYHLVPLSFRLSGPERFGTLEAAKRAAQIEWEAFILSTCNL